MCKNRQFVWSVFEKAIRIGNSCRFLASSLPVFSPSQDHSFPFQSLDSFLSFSRFASFHYHASPLLVFALIPNGMAGILSSQQYVMLPPLFPPEFERQRTRFCLLYWRGTRSRKSRRERKEEEFEWTRYVCTQIESSSETNNRTKSEEEKRSINFDLDSNSTAGSLLLVFLPSQPWSGITVCSVYDVSPPLPSSWQFLIPLPILACILRPGWLTIPSISRHWYQSKRRED